MLFPVRRAKLLERRSGVLSSYSPLDGQRDIHSPAQPPGVPPAGSPSLLTGTGRCSSGRTGLPSRRGAARTSRSCCEIPGTVPVSPSRCPQTPEGCATHPPTPVATRTPLPLHPQCPCSIPAPRGSPSGRSRAPMSRDGVAAPGCPAHLAPGPAARAVPAEGDTGRGQGLSSAPHPPALCPLVKAGEGRGGTQPPGTATTFANIPGPPPRGRACWPRGIQGGAQPGGAPTPNKSPPPGSRCR